MRRMIRTTYRAVGSRGVGACGAGLPSGSMARPSAVVVVAPMASQGRSSGRPDGATPRVAIRQHRWVARGSELTLTVVTEHAGNVCGQDPGPRLFPGPA